MDVDIPPMDHVSLKHGTPYSVAVTQMDNSDTAVSTACAVNAQPAIEPQHHCGHGASQATAHFNVHIHDTTMKVE